MINKKSVAEKLTQYLHHETSLNQLVDWAETALMEDENIPEDAAIIANVLARIGVADVRAFGLTFEDCEEMLEKLGYLIHVDVVAA